MKGKKVNSRHSEQLNSSANLLSEFEVCWATPGWLAGWLADWMDGWMADGGRQLAVGSEGSAGAERCECVFSAEPR